MLGRAPAPLWGKRTARAQATKGCPGLQPEGRRILTICQAHPRRVAKVSSQIQREISELFVLDQVVQRAVCPEYATGATDQLSAIASVTDVYVSNDLQVVKVYVSIYSDEYGKRKAFTNLKRLEPYVRHQIGQRVRLRLTPEIRFEYDDSLEEMEKVQRLLEEEEDERQTEGRAAQGGAAAGASGASQEGFFDYVSEEEEEQGGKGEADEEEEEEEMEVDDSPFPEPAFDFTPRQGPFDYMFQNNEPESLQEKRKKPPARRK